MDSTLVQTVDPQAARKRLVDMQKLVRALEDDMRERTEKVESVGAALREQYDEAKRAGRTQASYESWRDPFVTQAAVAWVLGGVFVRFMEDNGLIDEVYLAGDGDRLARAWDAHETYLRSHPTHTDREYLESVFETVSKLPGVEDLLGRERNPLWQLGPSGDGARRLLGFWQGRDAATGALLRRFEGLDKRFLGDLYQDLSEDARKRYALLQTPEFVEEFILDRTLEPALETFGLEGFRMIDPTCGSGHFLLGAFRRLFERWVKEAPGENPAALAQRALDSVHGVDINPFAVAIARFRLLVAALQASGKRRLADAPDFRMNLAAGDSLLHGQRFDRHGQGLVIARDWMPDAFARGDYEEATRILGQQYHAVVGNPPYITDKDPAHNAALRDRYVSAFRKFSLGVPFTERFFDLATNPSNGQATGFVGLITANSFMKREFGSKLVEEVIPSLDLTHIVDLSGAYIPGHGTPTVILFGRNRHPISPKVRCALGVRGEPDTPEDATLGHVWRSIVDMLDLPGTENRYISVGDLNRVTFSRHPWSIGGGATAEVKATVEGSATSTLRVATELVGVLGMTNADEVLVARSEEFARKRVEPELTRPLIVGDSLRDWTARVYEAVAFPYQQSLLRNLSETPQLGRWLWPFRTTLGNRATFSKGTYFSDNLPWWKWHQVALDRLRTQLSLAYAEVATHNHFVLRRGEEVFNQTAPIIKLREDATEDDCLALAGPANSSVGCFWIRQACHNKGGSGMGRGIQSERWEERFQATSTALSELPIPPSPSNTLPYARLLDSLSRESADLLPDALCRNEVPSRARLDHNRQRVDYRFRRRVSLQEELDWLCYRLYNVIDEAPLQDVERLPNLNLGERAFEIVMARKMASGDLETTWFARHGSTPITELPADWPDDYKAIVQKRIDLIESHPYIAILEQPEHKRRWQRESWDDLESRALRSWLLDRLESKPCWPEPVLTTCARLADVVRKDPDFMQVAALYRKRDDFDLTALVTELVTAESVPYLPALRYTESGLRKREQWESTWALQRREDAGEKVDIPVPPKYTSADFQKTDYWRLRGKLDVPKERFISYPLAERDVDPTLVLTWAGFNHLDQAQALANYFVARRDQDGWTRDRLHPLLAGLYDLLPWLHQWHNEIDPDLADRPSTYFEAFMEEERRTLGWTESEVRAWKPPAKPTRRRKAGR